ncbi:P-loop containing nucleoside triphosphate hydrolase protein, partial [Cytidiella melzeri]
MPSQPCQPAKNNQKSSTSKKAGPTRPSNANTTLIHRPALEINEASIPLPEGCPKSALHFESYRILKKSRYAANQDPEQRYSSFVTRMRMEKEIARVANGIVPRFFQQDCAEAFLLGLNTGLICATGSGKTEAFLLPLLADPMSKSKILVISTLNALEVDQAERFQQYGISAVAVNGETYDDKMHDRLARDEIRVVITSPEMVFKHPQFSQLVRDSKWTKNLIGTVVDEVHCVLEWGKEFWRDFDDVENTRSYMSRKPIMFCTATLTPAMLDQLLTKLSFPRSNSFILNLGNECHNVTPIVCPMKGPMDFGALDFILDEALQDLPQELVMTLIYAETRAVVMMIWMYLTRKVPPNSPYREQIEFMISTRDGSVKTIVLAKFLKNVVKVLVSTECVGMGLDVPGMPRMIQFGTPRSLLEWQQHAGRAGRGGEQSYALLLLEPSVSEVVNRKKLQKEAILDSKDIEYRKKVEGNMREFALTKECRRRITIKHFD